MFRIYRSPPPTRKPRSLPNADDGASSVVLLMRQAEVEAEAAEAAAARDAREREQWAREEQRRREDAQAEWEQGYF